MTLLAIFGGAFWRCVAAINAAQSATQKQPVKAMGRRIIKDESGITPDDAVQIVTRCASDVGTPEVALWVAVLNRALLDSWVGGEYEKAKAFISSGRAEAVCDLCGVDIDFFRDIAKAIKPIPAAIVARWKAAKETEHAKARLKRKTKKVTR